MALSEIQEKYQQIYGRTGEPEGVEYWESTGLTGNALRQAMIEAGKAYGQTYAVDGKVYTNPVAEIEKGYQDIYGRAGEAEGIDYWLSTGLRGRELTDAMIEAGKGYGQTYEVGGQTFQNPVAEIERNYQQVYGRTGEPEGLQYWIGTGLRGDELRQAMMEAGKAYPSVYEVGGKSYLNPMVPGNPWGFDQAAYDKAYQAWLESAVTEPGLLTAGPGEFTESPGYQFRLLEGQKALERGAAARGNLLGGATAKALTRYGQEYATADYDNFLRRYYDSLKPWQSLAGVGQTSATAAAGQAGTFGANIGGAITGAGNIAAQNAILAGQAVASGAQNIGQATATGALGTGQATATGALGTGQAIAGGQINQANVLTGALGSGINNYLMWKYLNPSVPAPGSYTGGTTISA